MSAFNFKFDEKSGEFIPVDEEAKQSNNSVEQSNLQPSGTIQQFSLKFDKEEGVWRQYDEPKAS